MSEVGYMRLGDLTGGRGNMAERIQDDSWFECMNVVAGTAKGKQERAGEG